MNCQNNKIKFNQFEGLTNNTDTVFYGGFSIDEPNRKHNKKRIQKKWIKRYGYKCCYGILCDEIIGEKIKELHIQQPIYWRLSTTPISPDGSGITEPSSPKYKRQIYSSGLIFDPNDLKLEE